MREPPTGAGPRPPCPSPPGGGGPALVGGGGGGGAAHDGCGRQPAPAGEWRAAGGGAGAAVGGGRAHQLLPGSLCVQVWELRERLGRVRGFWAGLPLTVCGDPRVAADVSQEAAPCWTGAGRGR